MITIKPSRNRETATTMTPPDRTASEEISNTPVSKHSPSCRSLLTKDAAESKRGVQQEDTTHHRAKSY
jgi:hypothetical protein